MTMRLSCHGGHYDTGMGYETMTACKAPSCDTYLVKNIKTNILIIHYRCSNPKAFS